MPPTFFERLFADDRPLYAWLVLGAIVAVARTEAALAPTVAASPWNLVWCVALLPVAAALGVMLAFFPGCFFLTPLYRLIAWRNGAPFRLGDEVVILSKRFPGRVARVYEIWDSRGELRVDLDEQSRKDVTDVFSYADVRRRRPGEPLIEPGLDEPEA